MKKYFVIRNIRGKCSSVGVLKGYMVRDRLETPDLGLTIWDNIDLSLHDSSPLTFKKEYRDVRTSAYDDR